MRGRLAWVAAVAAAGCWGWAAQAEAHVYWANNATTTIGRANLDGSGANQGFIAGANSPFGVAVDGRRLYWTNAGTGTIGRANLDGSGVNQGFIAGASDPSGVAVDGQHIYWANSGTGTIGRANLDGSGANPSFIAGANNPSGVAVDGQRLYWTNAGTGTIGRANLDGSGANQGFIAGANFPTGVAVDGQRLYWTNFGTGTIGRANLDGSGATQGFIAGASSPSGVAVDGQHLYWTNLGTDTIGRANLDGSGATPSFIAGASNPVGVAVDGGPAGSAVASAASLSFGTQPLGTFGAPQSVTITNAGHGDLQIDAARIADGDVDDFVVTHDTCSQSTLTIGGTCTVRVRFGPSAGGERQAMLALTGNDTASPLQIALQGTAGQLPQGPTGATGATGPTGATGATGATGRHGRHRGAGLGRPAGQARPDSPRHVQDRQGQGPRPPGQAPSLHDPADHRPRNSHDHRHGSRVAHAPRRALRDRNRRPRAAGPLRPPARARRPLHAHAALPPPRPPCHHPHADQHALTDQPRQPLAGGVCPAARTRTRSFGLRCPDRVPDGNDVRRDFAARRGGWPAGERSDRCSGRHGRCGRPDRQPRRSAANVPTCSSRARARAGRRDRRARVLPRP